MFVNLVEFQGLFMKIGFTNRGKALENPNVKKSTEVKKPSDSKVFKMLKDLARLRGKARKLSITADINQLTFTRSFVVTLMEAYGADTSTAPSRQTNTP